VRVSKGCLLTQLFRFWSRRVLGATGSGEEGRGSPVSGHGARKQPVAAAAQGQSLCVVGVGIGVSGVGAGVAEWRVGQPAPNMAPKDAESF
jgi:hypothetical protein